MKCGFQEHWQEESDSFPSTPLKHAEASGASGVRIRRDGVDGVQLQAAEASSSAVAVHRRHGFFLQHTVLATANNHLFIESNPSAQQEEISS